MAKKTLADPQTRDPTRGWIPRHEALASPCVSCPFSTGNDAEFGAMVLRLKQAAGMKVSASAKEILDARYRIKMDIVRFGPEFVCHGSGYDKDMKIRPSTEHRQCPGAIDFARKDALARGRPTT